MLLWFFGLTLLLPLCHCELLVCSPSDPVTCTMGLRMPLYSTIPWRDQFEPVYNATLINLLADRTIFDFCDLSSYSLSGIIPLLKHHGYHSDSGGKNHANYTDGTNKKWIAFIPDTVTISRDCDKGNSWTTGWKMKWPRIGLAAEIQGKLMCYQSLCKSFLTMYLHY
jgi:hypothetical protein